MKLITIMTGGMTWGGREEGSPARHTGNVKYCCACRGACFNPHPRYKISNRHILQFTDKKVIFNSKTGSKSVSDDH